MSRGFENSDSRRAIVTLMQKARVLPIRKTPKKIALKDTAGNKKASRILRGVLFVLEERHHRKIPQLEYGRLLANRMQSKSPTRSAVSEWLHDKAPVAAAVLFAAQDIASEIYGRRMTIDELATMFMSPDRGSPESLSGIKVSSFAVAA